MKKTITAICLLAAFTGNAQDISIGNLDAGFEYSQTTGELTDVYFTLLSNNNSGPSSFKVGLYFVPPAATEFSEAFLIGSISAPSMSGHSSRDVTDWDVNVNDASPVPPNGNYRLLVYADYDKKISESDENNNGLFLSSQGDDLSFTAGGSTGIGAMGGSALVSVISYPNPAHDKVSIQVRLNKSTTGNVTVYDMNGRNVSTLLAEGSALGSGLNRFELDATQLARGVYSCKVQTSEGMLTHKLIIR